MTLLPATGRIRSLRGGVPCILFRPPAHLDMPFPDITGADRNNMR